MSTAVPKGAQQRPRSALRRARVSARRLGGYADAWGRPREVVARSGRAGTVLVIDRDAREGREERLIAHLAADEPTENAALVCHGYLRGGLGPDSRCRLLTAEDARTLPFQEERAEAEPRLGEVLAVDAHGDGYGLFASGCRLAIRELRWCRLHSARDGEEGQAISLREAVGLVEDYEPLCRATRLAIARHRGDASLSTTALAAELSRVQRSPIVLNRRLRETVQAAVERGELSMSAIALRCGRAKRDRNGNLSGETSWLARRLGLAPEGGQARPTPWIHTDVLALIARDGLGMAPREVEL